MFRGTNQNGCGRYFWILFTFGVLDIRPVVLLTSPCQQSLIDQCARLITGFTPQKYLSGLVPDSAIRDDCEAFASVRLCNDKVLRPCLAAELVSLDPFIRQANEFVMLFCENDQFRQDYAHHGQCLAVTSMDVNQCIANYGTTVSDIAAISDVLTPQEVLHRSCCDGLFRLTSCAFDAAKRKCHPSSADFVKKFLYKMMKSTLQDWIARQCFEYQPQCNTGKENMIPSPLDDRPPSAPPVSTTTEVSAPISTAALTPITSSGVPAAASPTTGNAVTKNTLIIGDGGAESTRIILPSSTPEAPREDGTPVIGKNTAIQAAVPVLNDDMPPATKVNHRPIAIKALPEKSKASSRIRNTTASTHPLARKFLLLISTIAFLAGWY